MIVMKFGGSSVGSASRIKNVATIVKQNASKNPIVVVSAVGGITDQLILLANEAVKGNGAKILSDIKKKHIDILEKLDLDQALLQDDFLELDNLVANARGTLAIDTIDTKKLDIFVSFGERMSSKIVAACLHDMDVTSLAWDAWDFGFTTNAEHGNADIMDRTYRQIAKVAKKLDHVPVVTGFLAKTRSGEITTLGRGGSDYTAAIIGAAILAKEIQIWTDVDGVMSTDPRIVKSAKTIPVVSFAEASELAFFGAKVLHPKTIVPAVRHNIPVKVLNTFNPTGAGTTILERGKKTPNTAKAVSHKENITLITVTSSRMLGMHGFLAKLFTIFKKYQKSVDVVATSEVSVSLTIADDSNTKEIISELEKIAQVSVLKNKAIVCVIGEGMKHMPGVAGKIFMALGKNKINVEMISQGASEINITFVVDGKDALKAVKVTHAEFVGK